MARLADLTVWLLTTFVEAFVVYLLLIQGLFHKFRFLSFYLLLSAVTGATWYALFSHFPLATNWVRYFYFREVLLWILLFLSICELTAHLVGTRIHRRKLLQWSSSAVIVAALLSVSALASWDSHAATEFLFRFSLNMFYISCLAIVLLWTWKLRNDPEDRIAAQLVNVLGIYFSISFLIYEARITLHVDDFSSLQLMVGAWLPLGCGFAIVSYQQPRSTTH
jgi:hypothetical protein